jgi:hypothetical protein
MVAGSIVPGHQTTIVLPFGKISAEARRQPIPEAYVHGALLMTSTP